MIDQLEILALKAVALRDPEYFQRKVCRYYSEKFHTPLIEVYELPWPFVFTNYLEHIIEVNNGKKEIYDLAIDICYPEIKENEEEALQRRIKEIETEEELKRQAHKKKVEERKAQQTIRQNPRTEEPDIVMESTSFEHLEKEMGNENE
jgi:hypothetical protein